MKLFSANIEDLRTLYISNLKKALDMEQKVVRVLPDLVEQSSESTLKAAFVNHLEETRGHIRKVESLLRKHIGETATEACKTIGGLATDASDTIKDVTDPTVRDVALVGAAQQVEHHEIAVYGTLYTWAVLLGLSDDASILKMIKAEEVKTDHLLTQISEHVNYEAAA
jgi:ferritin-like metal-binding protein YciE